MNIIEVPLAKLTSLGNVRSRVDTSDPQLLDLARSMQEDGQEVEIRIYPVRGGKYTISKGHRRYAAATINGWPTLRAVVIDPPADEAAHIISQYNENERRLGLTYLEKARTYARLKELGWKQKEIAVKFGISDSDVSLALATLRADPKLQKAVEEGRIKPSAIEPLLSQPLEVQAVLADAAINARTVREVSNLVKAHKRRGEIFESRRDEDMGDEPFDLPEFDESEQPDITDPLEELAIEEIEAALEHARQAAQTPILNPGLVRTARPKVEELLRTAASLKALLDGKPWDDTKDLLE